MLTIAFVDSYFNTKFIICQLYSYHFNQRTTLIIRNRKKNSNALKSLEIFDKIIKTFKEGARVWLILRVLRKRLNKLLKLLLITMN